MKVIKHSNNLPLFDQFFDGFFLDEPKHWMNRNHSQGRHEKVNIIEDNDQFEIELVAPGYRKEDLRLEVDGNMLHLKAERKEETENQKKNYLRREFQISSFERKFELPEDKISLDQIEARFEDGVLIVRLPKKPELKKVNRMIEVQ